MTARLNSKEAGRVFFAATTHPHVVTSAVSATPGLALIFNQYPDEFSHNGEEVTKGVKYLMRTDVMYRRL